MQKIVATLLQLFAHWEVAVPQFFQKIPQLYFVLATGCGAYIEKLSALTAYELKKARLHYRIVDTTHVLTRIYKLNGFNILEGKDITLVSIDIVDMFTNIPRDIGGLMGDIPSWGSSLAPMVQDQFPL